MKKTGILILLSCSIICGCSKEYIEMDAISSHSTTSADWYELDIDVIADEDDVSDKEACSREIIQHILDNDFHSIHFSFDVNGYPNNVSVDVFTSEKNAQKDKEAYSFEYVTEFNTENPDIQNNIKDNPEEFEIQYE
ncbi:hypothetical protein GN277_00740 [Lachnospiraceae bacterium WCA-9-b2]|uniref:Lipoprotein n=1 Tax=Sporofaciens musculi TaxID=2681861 RepID=A0A7X3MCR1_9FIRM|nr:hypothetical protein [Sporofaciens musculi]MXP74018.1 hypothetical protein [Sporofaciens musculi]